MYSKKHNTPYDRGSADSYYGRPRAPHYYVAHPRGDVRGEQTRVEQLTQDEIDAYNAGYNDNEASGAKKEW
jgi:hypothetical protein